MISLSRSTDRPTFKVGPQSVLRDSESAKHGQQITFKTDRCQYKDGFRTISSTQISSQINPSPSQYSRRIRFADPKTQTRFTPKQNGPDERPAKRSKVVRYARDHAEQSFSVRKPLRIRVPTDAWQLIFQRCDLAFLLKARLVCRAFRDILDRQALWREARNNCYGDEIPDCPLALTELQYAILLVGRGCQIPPCTRKDTRKVYWPFMLRMCEKCFSQMVEVPSLDYLEVQLYSAMYWDLEYEVRQTIPAELPGLLPAGQLRSSRWAGPRWLDREHRTWLEISLPENTVVLADDYEALRLDFNEKVQDDPDYFLFWARLKWGETREKMTMATKLSEIDVGEPSRPYDLREQKVTLFAEKALELDPPMSVKMLGKFAAYHSALNTPNAASLRSWDALKAKIDIPELRAQAEQLIQWEEETQTDDVFSRIHRHRNPGRFRRPKRYTQEQKVVIEIAHERLEELLNVVHDEDVLLMWFDRVRQTYESLYQKPDGLNGDGTYGPYDLSLDDASMIVQDILQPKLANAAGGLDRYKRILTTLRCMGCTRSNTATTYNFRELIFHARKAHAGYVAKDSFWYRLAVPVKSYDVRYQDNVAWYQLPWFKTMPALPFHRKPIAGMIWNPDVETQYIRYEAANSSPAAFEIPVTYHTRIPGDDFTSNFCRAVRTLTRTRLDSLYVIKVAFEYATRRRTSRSSAATPAGQTTVKQLQSLETVCARFTSRIEFKFQCQLCAKEVAESRDKRRPPKLSMLSTLVKHWRVKHRLGEDICVTEHIVLPSEPDLMETMEREDAKLEAEKVSQMKKSTQSDKSLDPRTAALLQTPSIRSCFDKLFVLRSGEEAHFIHTVD